MSMELTIDGLDELIEFIDKLEDNAEKAIDEALIAGGDLLKQKYEQEVYSHYLTRRSGLSARSITRTEPENNELFVGIRGGAKVDAYYLYMQEYGYWHVRKGTFIAPKPTFSVIYENYKNEILNEYIRVLRMRLGL